MNANDCIFCKIAYNEIPSFKIYEDEFFLVMLDKFPSSLGHTLVIPKKHFKNIFELDQVYSEKLFPLIKKITEGLKKSLGIEDFNILQNNGLLAGQTVFHFHVHIIPRKENDDVNVKWKTVEPNDKDFENILVQIKNELMD